MRGSLSCPTTIDTSATIREELPQRDDDARGRGGRARRPLGQPHSSDRFWRSTGKTSPCARIAGGRRAPFPINTRRARTGWRGDHPQPTHPVDPPMTGAASRSGAETSSHRDHRGVRPLKRPPRAPTARPNRRSNSSYAGTPHARSRGDRPGSRRRGRLARASADGLRRRTGKRMPRRPRAGQLPLPGWPPDGGTLGSTHAALISRTSVRLTTSSLRLTPCGLVVVAARPSAATARLDQRRSGHSSRCQTIRSMVLHEPDRPGRRRARPAFR